MHPRQNPCDPVSLLFGVQLGGILTSTGPSHTAGSSSPILSIVSRHLSFNSTRMVTSPKMVNRSVLQVAGITPVVVLALCDKAPNLRTLSG